MIRQNSEIFLKLQHISDLETLHSWNLNVNFTNQMEPRFKAIFERVTDDNNTEKVYTFKYLLIFIFHQYLFLLLKTMIEGILENMVFLKRPYAIRGCADFKSTRKFDLSSHVDFNLTAGHSDDSVELYELQPEFDQLCPKEILLFHPPPTAKFCDASSFSNISMLSKYTVDLHVANVC